MKKYILGLGLFAAFLMVSAPEAKADVIPMDYHPVDRCVRVVNLSAYPDTVLIGYHTGPMVDGYKAYQIKEGECLTMGYKFNTLAVYTASKQSFASMDLTKLALSNLRLLSASIEPYGGTIPDANPLNKETIEYSLTGSQATGLSLVETKHISDYNNGQPEKIELLNQSQLHVQPSPQQMTPRVGTKMNFWQWLGCFLGLYGKGCQ